MGCFALLGLAKAAPAVTSHQSVNNGGALTSTSSHLAHAGAATVAHSGHSQVVPAHHGHAVHAVAHPVAHHAVAHAPVVSHAVHHAAPLVHAAPLAHHAVHHAAPVVAHPVAHHAVAHHAVHAAPVVSHAVHHAAPVVHAAPAYHAPAPVVHAAPVVKVAPAYHAAPVVHVKETPEPYTHTYGVADDYSKANFNAAETSDSNGVVSGSYQVSLPDGRIQHVKYTADHVNGYVAEVTYEGTPVYPEAKPYVAPKPAYHA